PAGRRRLRLLPVPDTARAPPPCGDSSVGGHVRRQSPRAGAADLPSAPFEATSSTLIVAGLCGVKVGTCPARGSATRRAGSAAAAGCAPQNGGNTKATRPAARKRLR